MPGERDGQHRRDEPPLVQAAHPEEARVLGDVIDDDRLAACRRAPGDALAERNGRAADVVPVHAVGRGERQRHPVAVHEIQGRHLGAKRDPGPVHDGLEELLPGLGGGREPEQLVKEPQLGDGVVGGRRIRQMGLGEVRGLGVGAGRSVGGARLRAGITVIPELCHVHHPRSLGAAVTELGCGPVPGRCPCSRTVTEERLTGAPGIGILARWNPAPGAHPEPDPSVRVWVGFRR